MAARDNALRDNGLPAKENTLFKSIVKHYETKQYKKGLKAADIVLRKFPEHGETNAMKGLILNCMERKAEAYELVRKGVKMDIKSHVCWHVYGLLYRSDREYLQAIKCYRSALRWDPENIQILRDLSLLQVQMRDLDGFVQTRQQLLTLKPTNRNNWFSFALSQQLRGRYKQALGVVDAYEATLEGAPENDYEHSEMLLYKNLLFEEGGMLEDAVNHLDRSEPMLVDKLFYHEKKAQLLLKLGRFEEALAVYRKTLMKRNAEHYGYHAGLQAATLKRKDVVERWAGVDASEEVEQVLGPLYKELQLEFPRSSICKRLPLDFARSAPYFREVAAAYIIPLVRKGVPSLFADIKPLYVDSMKAEVLGDLFRSWLDQLERDGKLSGEALPELPSSILWVRILYAQHLDKMRDTEGALAMIDRAIEHTPTLLDLHMLKARIFKHAGAFLKASEQMEIARKMDLADRYLNTKSTRYLLRANLLEDATKTIALFTKDGENSSNLFDMQCMWYELEVAHCYLRQGDFGRALKNFTSVEKHFGDIVEDQFDFHTYCIRKMTLRAYVRLLQLEDHVYGHTFFVKAACGIIETYLRIADRPKSSSAEAAEAATDDLSAAERKKAESKRRKAEAKAKAEAEAKAKAEAAAPAKEGKGKKGGKEKVADEDPDGAALANVESPLERATVYLRTLQTHASNELCTHTYAFELYMRKRRFLLALRALRKAVPLSRCGPAETATVHRLIVRFFAEVRGAANLPATLLAVIELQSGALGLQSGCELIAFNASFLEQHHAQPAAKVAAAEMLALLAPERKAEAVSTIASLDPSALTLDQAIEALAALGRLGDAAATNDFKAKAHGAFQHATVFAP
ncbi:hypothetical protein AB1Y20_019889 [Prymnesium parvum]|uniref:Uncharacterized protein n=1 Tax=Prymnesium parvum TaxID=97485 RepID=A0AB34JS46_PRYPA|mmetsp:Transcript_7998/g.19760  ORF Transcript_7998/g.19760 Transcript_7998/m.19760 type:complete len:857 (-) Transcript_7998:258-2828(-)